RSDRDWSSDVCSSDLFDLVVSNPPYVSPEEELRPELTYEPREALVDNGQTAAIAEAERGVVDGFLVFEVHEHRAAHVRALLTERSEERRVGKECGCGG